MDEVVRSEFTPTAATQWRFAFAMLVYPRLLKQNLPWAFFTLIGLVLVVLSLVVGATNITGSLGMGLACLGLGIVNAVARLASSRNSLRVRMPSDVTISAEFRAEEFTVRLKQSTSTAYYAAYRPMKPWLDLVALRQAGGRSFGLFPAELFPPEVRARFGQG